MLSILVIAIKDVVVDARNVTAETMHYLAAKILCNYAPAVNMTTMQTYVGELHETIVK